MARVGEMAVSAVAEKLRRGDAFVLLDVREPHELEMAAITAAQVVSMPMSELAEKQHAALPAALADRSVEIAVMCHHGFRSAQVAGWLVQQGFTRVSNIPGGIAAYAREVDPDIGSY